MNTNIKTYNPTNELSKKVDSGLLRDPKDRLDLLARIALMGVDGYTTEAVTNKGQVVKLIKHDLSASIRALTAIDKMLDSKLDSNLEFNLVIKPTN